MVLGKCLLWVLTVQFVDVAMSTLLCTIDHNCLHQQHPPPSFSPPLSRSVHRPRTPCPPRFHDTYSRESHGRLKVRQKYIRPGGAALFRRHERHPQGFFPVTALLSSGPPIAPSPVATCVSSRNVEARQGGLVTRLGVPVTPTDSPQHRADVDLVPPQSVLRCLRWITPQPGWHAMSGPPGRLPCPCFPWWR